ncbi:dTDP-4-amino-4,6-dideoxygalactose transaminase [Anaerosolibacter carboniphilus]|uniref:dTDP-4-amino-4,6-dideoxygalactose transaminase n=1 Tax=Anaerosolibacter carboniphilus TaxID=1417629 RepID=A0A841KPV2_9FIRM|nr:DegT/DnrJ/EryC1/StrS family aminotransferase [Anaerosolibacter carboniphilus]MBB6215361.1 dTDP-4-amino-4,6-dideoxygalactose transaminase [Anaerosolibacter carboniphilus]
MIPLVKPMVGIEEQMLMNEVLFSGKLAQGEYVEKFERDFALYLGSNYCVATSSGTSALHIALLSSGIQPGEKVITTPFSFIATANAILYAQAVPVFSDIELQDYNISPQCLLDTIKKHPDSKAMIIVHLYGHPACMEEIMEIANQYNLIVIEDCAQAHGASINGKKVGTFGHFGAFSFYPTKNMTCGEGGMITTQVKEMVQKARSLINHGQTAKYHHDLLGYNYRMTNIHAAIGIEQLHKLPGFNERRKEIAKRYSREITNPAFMKPICLPGFEHVYHQYTLAVNNRNRFITFLEAKGIGYGIHYPKTIPDQPLYLQRENLGSFTNARKAAERVVSIPVHPALTEQEVDYIISNLQKYAENE